MSALRCDQHTGVFLAAAVTGLASMSGCGGGPIALTESIKPDRSVNWIFSAGTELSLDWGLYPSLRGGHVSGGSVKDDRLILLCNLGQQPELLQPSRAFVLDIKTGSVLQSIAGPNQTSAHEWRVTSNFAIVKDRRQGKEIAFDLQQGRLCSDWAPADETALARAPELRESEILFDFERRPNLRQCELELDAGSVICITEEARQPLTCVIAWVDRQGSVRTRLLCELPHRPIGMSRPTLFADDDDQLIFSWSEYVICIDPKRLDGWNKSTDGVEADPARRAKVRDSMGFFAIDSKAWQAAPRSEHVSHEEAELQEVHVCGLYWLDEDRIPKRYLDTVRENVSFVIAVREGGYTQLRDFVKRARFAFTLRAQGYEDIVVTQENFSGTCSSDDGRFQGYMVRLDDAQLAKFECGAAYTLVPSSEGGPFLWRVNGALGLRRP